MPAINDKTVILSYTLDGISFTDFKIGTMQFGGKLSSTEITQDNPSAKLLNAIDIDWDNAALPKSNIKINSTGDLLKTIDNLYVASNDANMFSLTNHEHNSFYSLTNHSHDMFYTLSNHAHNNYYSMSTHTHNNYYSLTNHAHNSFYSLTNHSHDMFYTLSDHAHNNYYSMSTHTHNNYYSLTNHSHDSYYSLSNHEHSIYSAVKNIIGDNNYSLTAHSHDSYYLPTTQYNLKYSTQSPKVIANVSELASSYIIGEGLTLELPVALFCVGHTVVIIFNGRNSILKAPYAITAFNDPNGNMLLQADLGNKYPTVIKHTTSTIATVTLTAAPCLDVNGMVSTLPSWVVTAYTGTGLQVYNPDITPFVGPALNKHSVSFDAESKMLYIVSE